MCAGENLGFKAERGPWHLQVFSNLSHVVIIDNAMQSVRPPRIKLLCCDDVMGSISGAKSFYSLRV